MCARGPDNVLYSFSHKLRQSRSFPTPDSSVSVRATICRLIQCPENLGEHRTPCVEGGSGFGVLKEVRLCSVSVKLAGVKGNSAGLLQAADLLLECVTSLPVTAKHQCTSGSQHNNVCGVVKS